MQLNKLNELRLEAYNSSCIYKERTKRWHDKHIKQKRFEKGDMIMLFNSRSRLFPGKLRSRWLRPFQVTKVQPSGAVEVWSKSTDVFTVNGQRPKPYLVEKPIEKAFVHTLTDPVQT